MSSRLIHVVAGARTFFLSKAGLSHCVYTPDVAYAFIWPWTLGCLRLSAVVSNAALNMGVQIPALVPAFSSRGSVLSSAYLEFSC